VLLVFRSGGQKLCFFHPTPYPKNICPCLPAGITILFSISLCDFQEWISIRLSVSEEDFNLASVRPQQLSVSEVAVTIFAFTRGVLPQAGVASLQGQGNVHITQGRQNA